MRVLTWNLNARRSGWWGDLRDRLSLLRSVDGLQGAWEVFFAQEVPPGGFDDLREGVAPAEGAWAWHEHEGKDAATATGAALLVRPPWRIEDAGMLDDAPSPKRMMCALAVDERTGQRVALASAALPPGGISEGERVRDGTDPWGERKADQARRLHDWVAARAGEGLPVMVGIDANAPRQDPPEWERVEYWWAAEALLLGADAVAKDAYRRWLAANPAVLDAIAKARPGGPLACTHRRGRRVPSRYDHVLVTDDVEVVTVRHVIEEAFAAGSDHAIVWADLRVPRS